MTRSFRSRHLALAALVLRGASVLPAQPASATLQSSLVGKTFFLRALCAGDDLRFGADGRLTGACTREPFTIGLLTVDQVEVLGSELQITAHRAGIAFQNNVPSIVDLSRPARGRKPHPVRLRIGPASAGSFDAPVAAVLTTSYDDILPAVPEAWLGFFKARLLHAHVSDASSPTTPQPDTTTVTQDEIDRSQVNPLAGEGSGASSLGIKPASTLNIPSPFGDGLTAQAGKDGVSIPKVIKQREASYSPQAKSMLYTGRSIVSLVIDKDGSVVHTWVQSPAGLALDEQALAAVSQYKLLPATRDGQPVPVRLNVQVSFQIF